MIFGFVKIRYPPHPHFHCPIYCAATKINLWRAKWNKAYDGRALGRASRMGLFNIRDKVGSRGHFLLPCLCAYRLTNQILHWICYLGCSAAVPDELGYSFDFVPGRASGMEELAWRSEFVRLNQAAEAAYSVQASDWSGGRPGGKERGSGHLNTLLFPCC